MLTTDAAISADHQPLTELNTTPLIDVMLVLIIMLIITMPLQSHAVKLDLPGDRTGIIVERPKNLLWIDSSGNTRWNGQPVTRAELRDLLTRSAAMAVEPELHLRPDPAAPYAVVDGVLADAKRAGVSRLGFVGNERYRRF